MFAFNDAKEFSRWINIVKGIGIILVVLGHTPSIHINLSRVIYTVHMPLFFFISGFLFRPNGNKWDYCRKQIDRYIVPYIAYIIINYLWALMAHVHGGCKIISHEFCSFALKEIFIRIYGGRVCYGVFWFIPVLFFTQQIFNLMLNRYSMFTVSLIVVFAYIVSLVDAAYVSIPLPLNINVVLGALPFFLIGYLACKKQVQNQILGYFSCSLFLFYIVLVIMFGGSYNYDMKYSFYGKPVISLFLACSGIMCVLLLARLLVFMRFIYIPFVCLGEASMVIMYVHLYPLSIGKFNDIFNYTISKLLIVLLFSFSLYKILMIQPLLKQIFLGESENRHLNRTNPNNFSIALFK